MGSREALILDCLKGGRRQWSDLETKLVRSGKMSKSTLSSHLKALETEGLVRRTVDTSRRPAVTYYSSCVPDSSDRERILNILKQIQSGTISSYERLPNGTEVWRAGSAPSGTKLEVTSQELAEVVGKPWRLIEEIAFAVGKELNLRIHRDVDGETHFSKKPF